jgi:serine/threonine protein phosphatase PrpC
MCSDGLYKQVPENDLVAIIDAEKSNPTQLLKTLSDKASAAPFSDNITIVFIEIEA